MNGVETLCASAHYRISLFAAHKVGLNLDDVSISTDQNSVLLAKTRCRATIKSELKLEKTLTFVLIATKTSWLFPQLKTEKNLTNCLEQCNWILIYILLHFMVYPLFKEQNLLSPKQFWGQKSPLVPANSFFVPQLVRRTEESISGQCNHQVPSTVNGTRKLAAGQDKEKTQKRHRKDTK